MLFLLAAAASPSPARAADPALVRAAEAEGEVVWYTSFVQDQLARPMAAAFEQAYPKIRVRVVAGTANDLLLRMLTEGRAGGVRADVSHGGSSVQPLRHAGLLDRYVPGSAAGYAPEQKDPDGFWTSENDYVMVAAVNTDLVPDGSEPRSYQDLLDPKWTGRMIWTATLVQGGPIGFIGTVFAVMGPSEGKAFLRRLAAQRIVNLPANQRVVLDQVIAGEYPLALMVFNNHVSISQRQGAPVKWLRLEPVTALTDPIFVLHGSPHPNAARLFVDFVLSPDGQQVFRQADYLPADPAVPPLTASLRPAEGGYAARVIPPAAFDKDAAAWQRTYEELFR